MAPDLERHHGRAGVLPDEADHAMAHKKRQADVVSATPACQVNFSFLEEEKAF